MKTNDFDMNDRKDYQKMKKDLEKSVPWIKLIELPLFIAVVYDITVQNKGLFNLRDVELELNTIIANRLLGYGYLVRISSDDEYQKYDLTPAGARYGLACTSKVRPNLYDIFIMWLTRNKLKIVKQSEAIKMITKEMEKILKRNGVKI